MRICLTLATTLAFAVLSIEAQMRIEGRVLDPSGQPVVGFTVNAADWHSAGGASGSAQTSDDGSFTIHVPPGIYAIGTGVPLPPLNPGLARADVRKGNVTGLNLRLSAQTLVVPDDPPRASLIEIIPSGSDGMAIVRGAAGAVSPGAFLILVTLDTGDATTAIASEDGSFQVPLHAPPGSSVLVKADPFGFAFRMATQRLPQNSAGMHLSLLAGTIVRAGDPPPEGERIRFVRSGLVTPLTGPEWTFDGTIADAEVNPGDKVRIEGMLRITSSALTGIGPMRVAVSTHLDRLAGPDGSGSLGMNTFASTLMTPTDFPIERDRNNYAPYLQHFDLTPKAADRAEAAIDLILPLPPDLPHGFYLPVVSAFFDPVPMQSEPDRFRIRTESNRRRELNQLYLPVIRVGAPQTPRIPTMLLADTIDNGTRGVRAVEDRSRFGLSARIRSADVIVVPRVDATGAPLEYRLEPFLPTVSAMVAGFPNLPMIPFRFPSGQLIVRVQSPDGTVREIGPSPFVQPALWSSGLSRTALRDFYGGHFAGTNLTECYRLTTLDPRFAVTFERDGKHVITVDGSIEDFWGNTWLLGGTYPLYVGRTLSIGSAVIPGTPFETGDVFTPVVILEPPVPANIEVRVRLAPGSDGSRMIEQVIRGRANRFGIFAPAEKVVWDQPGEYRVDIEASTGGDGEGWAGAASWGNVVAPRDSPILARGRRGMVNTQELGTPWFFRTGTPFPTLPHTSHPNPPFFSGDVFWAQESDTAFVMFTIQDPARLVTDLLRSRQTESLVPLRDPGKFDDREPLGELPLFSSRPDRVDPHVDPSRVDLWSYSYRYVERPMIAVRELVTEDNTQQVYWDFDEPYAGQVGMTPFGDLPNDFKFYFGGTVLRGPAIGAPLYATYGSLFILVPDDDPRGGTRVFPPFQGNGGGPSGGPLFTLKGRDIDIFFHPTGVRPGTILQRGERASFAGYSAPTLPSKIEIVVTSPSGATRTIRGQANKIGWFNFSAQDFVVIEPGVWRAKVKIHFDGRTSAGQVTEPFPMGDVLGSREGEFWFYVVDSRSAQLEIAGVGGPGAMARPSVILSEAKDSPNPGDSSRSARLGVTASARFVRPADGPIAITVTQPPVLTNIEMHVTTTIPGFILEEKRQTSLTYSYDAPNLAQDFPNLDLHDTGGDTVTISFLVSGTDPSGVRKHYARQVVIQGDELQMPDQPPRPPKRRAVR